MGDERSKVRFSIRFDLNDEDQSTAWNTLSNLKSGEKSAYCVKAILSMIDEAADYKTLVSEIMEMKNIIQNLSVTTNVKEVFEKEDANKATKDVLDFMKRL